MPCMCSERYSPIYINVMRRGSKTYKTTQHNKQTNLRGAWSRKTTKLATPHRSLTVQKEETPLAMKTKKKHKKEKLKQSKPTVSAQPKQKTYEMNENQTRLLGSFSLRINMWSSSCHYTIFKNIIITCYM